MQGCTQVVGDFGGNTQREAEMLVSATPSPFRVRSTVGLCLDDYVLLSLKNIIGIRGVVLWVNSCYSDCNVMAIGSCTITTASVQHVCGVVENR